MVIALARLNTLTSPSMSERYRYCGFRVEFGNTIEA